MLTGTKTSLVLSALLVLGCGGNAVDVGHSANRGWDDLPANSATATTPQTIYESEEAIFGFALDGDTLYALINHNDTFELVSCPLDRCRSERTILFSGPWRDQPSPISTPLVLSGGWLYWVVANGGTEGIASCPTTGCAAPGFVETRVASAVAGDGEGGAYWIEYGPSLMRITANSQIAERVRDLSGELGDPDSLVVRGDYVYVSDLAYDNSSIRRVRRDGTSTSELLTTDDVILGFSVSADAIYYASRILTGHLARCPLDGCTAGGTTFVANQRWPEGVLLDGNEVFWLNNQRLSQTTTGATLSHATLISCALPACASLTQRTNEVPLDGQVRVQHRGGKFAVGSRAIVWLEQFHGLGTSLRRLPR